MLKENSAMKLYFFPAEERWNPRALTWSGVGSSSPAPGDSRLGMLKAAVPRGRLPALRSTGDLPTKERRIQVARESQSQSGAEDDAKTNPRVPVSGSPKFTVSGRGASGVRRRQAAASASAAWPPRGGPSRGSEGDRRAASPPTPSSGPVRPGLSRVPASEAGPGRRAARGDGAREAVRAGGSGGRQSSHGARAPARPRPAHRPRDLGAAPDWLS